MPNYTLAVHGTARAEWSGHILVSLGNTEECFQPPSSLHSLYLSGVSEHHLYC